MKKADYPKKLHEIKLSTKQIKMLRIVLEDFMTQASIMSNKIEGELAAYYNGKADGINTIDRFLRGDMDAHDEFENG